MRRFSPLVLAAAALSACVAVTVERHHPRKGPVKEVGYIDYGGGQIRYSAEGWSWVVASRRRTALKLMSRNCGKDLEPAVTDEYTRSDADAAYNGEDIESSMKIGDEHFHIEHYVHLAYECRPKGAPAPAVSTTTLRGPSLVIPETSVSTATAAVGLSTAAPAAVVVSSSAVPSLSSTTLPAPEPPR
jgi:hypothetical protein